MADSRISGFHKLSVPERLRMLLQKGALSTEDYRALLEGAHGMTVEIADKLVENVIGLFTLPMGLALNFVVNKKPYLVPAVVEEPSVIAAMSSAAKVVAEAGGFHATSTEPILVGQVQAVQVPHPAHAKHAILQRKDELLDLANSLHPAMVARGGGAKDLEVLIHPSNSEYGDMVVIHLLVDTCDAMGANLVNTMCEGIASVIEQITQGKVFLRILSNLTDRSIVRARAEIPLGLLDGKGYSGADVRDAIVCASEFAMLDPYRAATNNKGIMNGIDAVALATGNDWRALEAAAHAFAAYGQRYTSLTRWTKNEQGDLVGTIEIPIKVGTVGGTIRSNPCVGLAHRLLGVQSARELAELLGAVGLAQNFAALRALATHGIQRGHMSLHARSVALSAGASAGEFDRVVAELLKSGEIKVSRAKAILEEIKGAQGMAAGTGASASAAARSTTASAPGRLVILGEHAVDYGRHALAVPLELDVSVTISDHDDGVITTIPDWGLEHRHEPGATHGSIGRALDEMLARFGLREKSMRIRIEPKVPRAMGLGVSAAMAVAVLRALSRHFGLGLSESEISLAAFESERIVQPNTSGLDNTIAAIGRPMLYARGTPPQIELLALEEKVRFVVGMTGVQSLTVAAGRKLEKAMARNEGLCLRIFDEIDGLVLEGRAAIEKHDLVRLGVLMDWNHGLLNAMGLSSLEIEELVELSRHHGALGAKLTGAAGGGSVVALCPTNAEDVAEAMKKRGYRAIIATI